MSATGISRLADSCRAVDRAKATESVPSRLWRLPPAYEAPSQVDDLEVAQFIYLLLNNQNVRQVIDTITSKIVLILGRFTPERKAVSLASFPSCAPAFVSPALPA